MADRLQIDKLTSDSWAHWKMQLRLYLTSKNLWTIVTGEEPRPAEGADDLQQWQQRETLAVTIVGLSIDKSLSYIVRNCTTSAEYYQALRAHFERAAGANVYHLLGQLFELQMKGDTSVEQHVKYFQDVIDKLTSIDQVISDQVKVHALLRSMPATYAMVRTSLQMRGDQVTLEECVQALLTEEQSQRGGSAGNAGLSTEGALPITYQGRGQGRGRGFGRGRGASAMRCFRCYQLGHRAVDCWRPATQERASAADEEDRLLVTSDKSGTSVSARWIVDSGATSHMTYQRKLLFNYKVFEQPRMVRLGNGRAMSAEGAGNVALKMLLPEQQAYAVILTDVLYVPGLRTNLLSVRAVTARGRTCQFQNQECHIRNGNRLMATANLVGQLYFLNCRPTSTAEVAQATRKDAATKLWHLRLGHVGQAKLHKLSRHGAASCSSRDKTHADYYWKEEEQPPPTPQLPRQLMRIDRRNVPRPDDDEHNGASQHSVARSARNRRAPQRYGFEEGHLTEEWALLSHDDDLPQTISYRRSPDAFVKKREDAGKIVRYNARPVAQGYAPRTRKKMLAHPMDVETASLYDRLEEEVFMDQPAGIYDSGSGRWRQRRSKLCGSASCTDPVKTSLRTGGGGARPVGYHLHPHEEPTRRPTD